MHPESMWAISSLCTYLLPTPHRRRGHLGTRCTLYPRSCMSERVPGPSQARVQPVRFLRVRTAGNPESRDSGNSLHPREIRALRFETLLQVPWIPDSCFADWASGPDSDALQEHRFGSSCREVADTVPVTGGTVSALAGQDVSVARESRLTLLVRRPHPVRPPAALARPPEGLLLAIGGRHPSSLDMRQEVQEARRPCPTADVRRGLGKRRRSEEGLRLGECGSSPRRR